MLMAEEHGRYRVAELVFLTLILVSGTSSQAASPLDLTVISKDTSVGAGETLLLVCVGFGQPRVDITWSRDGHVTSNSSLVSIYEEDLFQSSRHFKQSFLQLCSLEISDSGSYTCTTSNGLSSVNSTLELSVIGVAPPLDLTVISKDTSVGAGDTLLLVCVGFGQPRVDITWSRDGHVTSNSSLVSIYEEDLFQSSRHFKQSFLQLCSLEISDSGSYTCTTSNGLSSVNSTLELSVIGVAPPLDLTVISKDTSVGAGQTLLLVCVSFGQPRVDITWSRDGQVTSNSSLVSIYEEDLFQSSRHFKQSFLQLCSEISDSGSYTCTISDGISSINSTIELSVIGVELTVISNDTSVGAGETILLVCGGFGQPDVDITWSRDGQVISNSSLVFIYEEDLSRSSKLYKQSFLLLYRIEMSDSGTYTCTISNGLSSINSTIELSVIGSGGGGGFGRWGIVGVTVVVALVTITVIIIVIVIIIVSLSKRSLSTRTNPPTCSTTDDVNIYEDIKLRERPSTPKDAALSGPEKCQLPLDIDINQCPACGKNTTSPNLGCGEEQKGVEGIPIDETYEIVDDVYETMK